MAELVRDCSKGKTSTFTQIAFPIIQEIDNKTKTKNLALRKKARIRIAERIRSSKNEDQLSRKQPLLHHKIEKQPLNYIEVYQPQKPSRDGYLNPQLDSLKMDDREEQTMLNIYLLLRKKKSIFKVEEVKRKMRGKEHLKKGLYKQCQCCGFLGPAKHKCYHDICQKGDNPKCKKKGEEKVSKVQLDTQKAFSMAQELIEGPEVQGPQIATIKMSVKEEEMELPKIDRSEEESNKKEMEENQPEGQLEAIVETERISEVESKSEISQSRRNRSDIRSMGIERQREEEFSPDKKRNMNE